MTEKEKGCGWWYLSFADKQGFLGAAIVKGESVMDAAIEAHSLGVNPGGSVLGGELTASDLAGVPSVLLNRLLTVEDMEAAGWELVKVES